MTVLTRTPLTGTPAEIEVKARQAIRLVPDNGLAGTRLLELAVALAANPLLQVTVLTYTRWPSQELEVLLRGAPQHDAVIVGVPRSGAWCKIEWNMLAPVSNDTNIMTTASLITTILQAGRPAGEGQPGGKDLPDPQQILRDLPEDERDAFIAHCRQALDQAQDPARWEDLGKVLRLWRYRATVMKDPGYWQAREQARTGTGEWMSLEDYLRQRRGTDEQ